MLSYISGKDIYIEDVLIEEDSEIYYITLNGIVYDEYHTSMLLGLPINKYVIILRNCGICKDFNGNPCFKNEDDAIKAVIMLNMIK